MDPKTATIGAEGDLDNHMRSLLLRSPGADQGQTTTGQLTQPSNMSSQKGPVANPASHAATPRRRPNQAQRRQMSAEASILTGGPSPTPQPRSYMSSPRFSQSQQGPTGTAGWAFQPPHQGHNSYNHHGANWGQASPTWNNQSLPYRGPVSAPTGRGGSRQRASPNRDPRMPQSQAAPQFDMETPRPSGNIGRLYHPREQRTPPAEGKVQSESLDSLCEIVVADDEIKLSDITEKEAFRRKIEEACCAAIEQHERVQNGLQDFPRESVQLKCFGSLASGFATKSADVDLGLLSPLSPVQPDAPGSPIPRLLEKTFLDMGLGARLLTRTRVPIIKLCEKPPRQLRLDLLEERARWEAGVPNDADDGEAAAEESDRPEEGQQMPLDSEKSPSPNIQSRCNLDDLRQRGMSLARYYELAKRALREAGGRDVFEKSLSTFTDEDACLLNKACVAFIDGLADETLRDRLLGYHSLNRNLLSSSHLRRSLYGVYLQATTESLTLQWESRGSAGHTALELDMDGCISGWKLLQDAPSFEGPMSYDQKLNEKSIQLKGHLGVRLMTLSQGRYESASGYSSRMLNLAERGKLQDQPHNQAVVKLLHSWYVSGARQENIRSQMRMFLSSFPVVPFSSLVRRHKSLQLAHEYQRGIDNGAYEEDVVPLIEEYINVLRSPLRSPWEGVTLDPDTQKKLSSIWSLGDPWLLSVNQPRNRRDRLEFPKSGLGVQCDINFSPHLGLQNSLLLRCYSSTDPRVRPMVLFVKHWAKSRDINTPYRGTLGSYGYVLMVLHYLVNIADPFVSPNLQELAPERRQPFNPVQNSETLTCKGRDVRFWRNEEEIRKLASQKALNNNDESVGSLLRGFFEYYSQSYLETKNIRGFDWTQDVLSLRTHGGLLSKREKDWRGAKTFIEYKATAAPPSAAHFAPEQTTSPPEQLTSSSGARKTANTVQEVRAIKNRYLFAIEDPFETDHNVARTVSHPGIVAIREEFRRAWRIITGVAPGKPGSLESLVKPVVDKAKSMEQDNFRRLLEDVHGELPVLRRK